MADTKLSAETLVSAVQANYKIYVATDTGIAPDSNAARMSQVKDFLRTAFGTLNDTGGSFAEAAIQSEMEAASSTTLAVTPGRQHFHPGHPKVWAHITVSGGVPSLSTSYNVTSIADTAVGQVTVTIATDFSGTSWAPLEATNQFHPAVQNSIAAGSVVLQALDSSHTLVDPSFYSFAGLGDQA